MYPNMPLLFDPTKSPSRHIVSSHDSRGLKAQSCDSAISSCSSLVSGVKTRQHPEHREGTLHAVATWSQINLHMPFYTAPQRSMFFFVFYFQHITNEQSDFFMPSPWIGSLLAANMLVANWPVYRLGALDWSIGKDGRKGERFL